MVENPGFEPLTYFFELFLFKQTNDLRKWFELVYVIELHAVQFGNNWTKTFRGQPNWTEIWLPENFFIQLFPNWTKM